MDVSALTPTILWRRHATARRITLRIDAGRGKVVVTLPRRTAKSAGLALLRENAGWVAASLAALPNVAPIQDGASIAIEGIPHLIRHAPHGRTPILRGNALHVPGDPAEMPQRVANFLRGHAKIRLAARAVAKAASIGLAPCRVTVRDTRSRWGSCSAQGALMFCWRLVMAPPFVQDYVVAHEVAHLRHLDHGAAFWALADILSPHRREAVSWLQANGLALLRVGRPAGAAPTRSAPTGSAKAARAPWLSAQNP